MLADLERDQFTSLRLQPRRSLEISNSGLRSETKNGIAAWKRQAQPG